MYFEKTTLHHQILKWGSPGDVPCLNPGDVPRPPRDFAALPSSPSPATGSLWGGPGVLAPRWLPTFALSLSSFLTDMYQVDFKLIKIVEDRLVFGIDVPVVAQAPEEAVLAVVGLCHHALGEVHHPTLQELVRGVQRTDEFWGEGEAPELTQ